MNSLYRFRNLQYHSNLLLVSVSSAVSASNLCKRTLISSSSCIKIIWLLWIISIKPQILGKKRILFGIYFNENQLNCFTYWKSVKEKLAVYGKSQTWFQYRLTIIRTASSVLCRFSSWSIRRFNSSSALFLWSILSASFLFWNLKTFKSSSSWSYKFKKIMDICNNA